MPGMVAFGRRWGIASDDLVFPGSFELLLRVLWWIGTLILFTYHKGHFDCNGRGVLHTYLVGLLVVLGLIILSLWAIVYVSAQGTITNPGARRSMPALVYLRALLYIPEFVWACLGAVWVSDGSRGCDPATVGAVISAVITRSPLPVLQDQDLQTELENAAHYMQFAAAAYGWPLYVYSNLFTAPCKLSRDCCRTRAAEYDIVGGDHLGCHFSSILQTTGLQYRDFIYVSFHNQIYEIPFFVALDHKWEVVLVAVRGTLSLKDVLTDLSAECENLPVEGVSGPCYAHKGMYQAAGYIYKKLVNDGILNQAFSVVPEYKLVVTGHSLGAGTAALLAILLRTSFPTLKCYSFSPPGGLLSQPLAEYSKDFVVSVVLGKDLVPRLSIPNMEDLKSRILKIVTNCNKPKYRILLQGCWYELFGGDPDDFPTEMDSRREEQLSQPLLGEESLVIRHSSSYQSLASDDSPAHPVVHMPLYPPGHILYITEDGPSRRSCFSQVRYRADWSSETAFRSILISPRMLVDHMPDAVLRALNSLCSDGPFLCPSSLSNNPHISM
ncbi:sn1-specific diacylglycerol lipase beta [Poecilia latipinna]|uniref:sn1-specific diacylglycerol lipase beta n=1 Tax=Poecilia latipinna TaxID=48699 RepID=UPI00072DEABB|nr:PREDICTED: sn1-specific diacylglycerol lipase beta [Poecilia latipinna]